jgi:hypoxanthine phosphoribosyltransferase
MNSHVERVLIDRHAIDRRVREMAEQIAADYRRSAATDEPPHITLVSVLTGSLIFLADLIRQLPLMMRIRLITVSSYPGATTRSTEVKLEGMIPADLAGQHVLIIDDILDSGKTIQFVKGLIEARHPASVRTCMLLRKQLPTALAIHADYIGFDVPNEFVVGYGLDYNGYYRNLPDIVVLKPEVIGSEATP